MSITTLLRYLIGDRRAILAIAGDRRFLWVGFLFVLSAGFAREYDGADLLSSPMTVLRPLGASLLAAWVFEFVMRMTGAFRTPDALTFGPPPTVPAAPSERPPLIKFGSTLALFWMTAPLAWIYAIPVERFTDPLGATQANLAALGLVATWRVLLMVRVVSVLSGHGFLAALTLVLLFAEIVVLGIGIPAGVLQSIARGMGGIRDVSDSERLVEGTVRTVLGAGCWTFPVVLVASLYIAVRGRRSTPPELPARATGGPGLWMLASASLLVWPFVLPPFQAEQQLRVRTESKYWDDPAEALGMMSSHSPDDYPPHWEPPPAPNFRNREKMLDAVEASLHPSVAPWVRSAYLGKFRRLVDARAERFSDLTHNLDQHDLRPELLKLLQLAARIDERSEALRFIGRRVGNCLRRSGNSMAPEELAEWRRALEPYDDGAAPR